MPIYEYKCEDCGKVSEFLVGISKDATEIKCSACGGMKLKKLLSAGFVSTSGSSDCDSCSVHGGSRPSCCGGSCKH